VFIVFEVEITILKVVAMKKQKFFFDDCLKVFLGKGYNSKTSNKNTLERK
jgi:hypothetical protein